MSVALTEPLNLREAAAHDEVFMQSLSLAQLPRLVEALGMGASSDEASPVECDLKLSVGEDEVVRVRGRVETRWTLTCQRCLERFEDRVSLRVNWRSGALPEGDFELGDEPVRLADWIEDELLLALPAIPKHREREACGETAKEYLVASDEPPMRTPFANLKEMLNDRRD